jgi:hypothetical protein
MCRSGGAERESGAGNRNRTDDILLGKQTLYQLSYARIKKNPTRGRISFRTMPSQSRVINFRPAPLTWRKTGGG